MIITNDDTRWLAGAAKNDVVVSSYDANNRYEGQECMIASLVVDSKADRTIWRKSELSSCTIYRTLKSRDEAIAYVNRKSHRRAGMGRKLNQWFLVVPVGKENEF